MREERTVGELLSDDLGDDELERRIARILDALGPGDERRLRGLLDKQVSELDHADATFVNVIRLMMGSLRS